MTTLSARLSALSGPHQLLCRREPAGGLLFHTHEATFVELDQAGYSVTERWLRGGLPRPAPEEAAFLGEIMAQLPDLPARVRFVDHVGDLPEGGPAPVPGIRSAPTLVDFQITDRCGLGCPQCYAGSLPDGAHARREDILHAIGEMADAGVCQVAIGGGEPLTHPDLPEMLAAIRTQGMVPNLTTTGLGLTRPLLSAMKEHCGAVAMSLEAVGERFATRRRQGFTAFQRTAAALLEAGIPLVMQVTVSAANLVDLPAIAAWCRSLSPLYGVIFLAYKPSGRGEGFDRPFSAVAWQEAFPSLMRTVETLYPHTRVGFDCCFSPALAGVETALGLAPGTVVEGCSATRSGIGLSPRLDVLPCTFLTGRPLGNLRSESLIGIWRAAEARRFRQGLAAHRVADARCGSCAVNSHCLGGCSAWRLTGCAHKAAAAQS